jgi:ATP-dependent exoDNAse (exonuclease V) beta subunit (contains helicase and exonuclease domains)
MSQKEQSVSIYIRKQSELFKRVQENSSKNTEPDNIFQQNKNKRLIEAGAGTGKTFTVVELVLELMFTRNIPLKSMGRVTFTEKATTELRLRLRTKLRENGEGYEEKVTEWEKKGEGSQWEIKRCQRDQVK